MSCEANIQEFLEFLYLSLGKHVINEDPFEWKSPRIQKSEKQDRLLDHVGNRRVANNKHSGKAVLSLGLTMRLLLLRICCLSLLPLLMAASSCSHKCGSLKNITYPFGIGDGCGNPNYTLQCNNTSLLLQNQGSSYTVDAIDYAKSVLVIRDPGASGCPNFTSGSIYSLNSSLLYLCQNSSSKGASFPSATCVQGSCVCQNRTCCFQRSGTVTDQCTAYSYSSANLSASALNGLELALGLGWKQPKEATNCSDCINNNGVDCGYNSSSTAKGFVCICKSRNITSGTCPANTTHKPEILSGALAVAVIVFVLLLGLGVSVYWKWKKYEREEEVTEDPVFPAESPSSRQLRSLQRIITSHHGREAAKLYSYADMQKATNFFSADLKLGAGGFGTVYKGTLEDGTLVAIKRSNRTGDQSTDNFVNEVTILSQVNHRNLVKLLGCCAEREGQLLIYEYVSNGTLFDHLHGKLKNRGLNWDIRLQIAVETAEALAYLHSAAYPPIYHRDVKSANILLDETFMAKVSDFGLSRLVPADATHVSTMVRGTPGYLDPEYYETFQLTEKSDVFSFGVVLLELITGQKPVDFNRPHRDANLSIYAIPIIRKRMLHRILDPNLQAFNNPEILASIKAVADLALECLATRSEDRPSMRQVLEELLKIKGPSRVGKSGPFVDPWFPPSRELTSEITIPSPTSHSNTSASGFNSTSHSIILESGFDSSNLVSDSTDLMPR